MRMDHGADESTRLRGELVNGLNMDLGAMDFGMSLR